MLGAKNHARRFPEVPGNARHNARHSMLGAKMIGVHIRHTGFPFIKEQTERYHTTIYIIQQNETVYMKNTYFHKFPVFK